MHMVYTLDDVFDLLCALTRTKLTGSELSIDENRLAISSESNQICHVKGEGGEDFQFMIGLRVYSSEGS